MNHKTILVGGGSYNPIHNSHTDFLKKAFLSINKETVLLDEVWLLVAAQNPDKPKEGMAPYPDRVNMCKLHVKGQGYEDWLRVSEFEGGLEPPYDTHTVLKKLQNAYPDYQFVWVMGSDNLMTFHTWENWQDILDHFPVVIVKRECSEHLVLNSETLNAYNQFVYSENCKFLDLPNIRFVDAGLNIGRATHIREAIESGKSTDDLHEKVLSYIQEKQLYR
jgi:nicotinate (nicotinamide) nucleotide adenylyltransferase